MFSANLTVVPEVWDTEGFRVLSWRRPGSPLSHCLSLHWFRSHVVVSDVRPKLGQAAVLRVLCVSVTALSRPCAGAEAGARLASRACGLRVPLLAASDGGLVAVVVTAFSSRHFRVFLVSLACTAVLAWLCLAPMGVVGLALGRPVLLVVPTSFRGPILGCQHVMAPACVASRPGGGALRVCRGAQVILRGQMIDGVYRFVWRVNKGVARALVYQASSTDQQRTCSTDGGAWKKQVTLTLVVDGGVWSLMLTERGGTTSRRVAVLNCAAHPVEVRASKYRMRGH
ncbi:hypothetical protein Taro_046590, partial [Colocasia esculenta]|nr:hypothetical protein [Colocasia esculenta]